MTDGTLSCQHRKTGLIHERKEGHGVGKAPK